MNKTADSVYYSMTQTPLYTLLPSRVYIITSSQFLLCFHYSSIIITLLK